MIGTYFILRKGIQSIMTMNSLVVPMMLTLSLAIISQTIQTPGATRFLTLTTDHTLPSVWLAPLLYTSFNLVMAMPVLVPLGETKSACRNLGRHHWRYGRRVYADGGAFCDVRAYARH